MTILEAIQKSTDFLAKKGVDSPRLQSELLLAHVLKTQRLKLYLDFARALTGSETEALRELVQRRGGREPLQHIIGATSFCGLEMVVNRHVLVPRPETELLAEQGWKFLNSLNRECSFLDFGTGSGCIAIALCHFATQARGVAIDKSPEAIAVAGQNATKNNVSSRVQFIESDRFAAVDPNLRVDLIISNPPYIPSAEIETLQEEVRKFDPVCALDGGVDGLEYYRWLAEEGAEHIERRGKIMVEFGDGQQDQIRAIFRERGWEIEAVLKDLTDRSRILVANRL